MATTVLSPTPIFKAFDNNGSPLVGGKLFTYQAGTSTKLATYTDSSGITPNDNPIILNARGECALWIPPNTAYKYVLAPSTDTDPPTNPIWTVDNVNNSVLITLYGGVDTGAVNAYVLNFTSNFSSYTDGIVIYWIPANTNTGASTINVNGLGPIAIKNGDGTNIVAGAITANVTAQIIIKGGQAILLNPYTTNSTGTFSCIWSGFSVAPASAIVNYTIVGRLVLLGFSAQTGTSNSTIFSLSGLPAFLKPSSFSTQIVACSGLIDSGAQIPGGSAIISSAGIVQFFKDGTTGSWTNSGAKGMAYNTTVVYTL